MINVLCWKWNHPGYKTIYTADHVNIFAAMVRRNTKLDVQITCVTDDANGIDASITIVPIWTEPNFSIGETTKPNCYRRMKIFSDEARAMFGERVVSIDLDCCIVSNIDHILSRQEDFIGWRKSDGSRHYQGSLTSHKTGTRTKIWTEFKGAESRKAASYLVGSDQAWVSHCLGENEAIYTTHKDGVYSYRAHILKMGDLPGNASIIFFHGWPKPFDAGMDNLNFIKQNYRL